MTGGTVVRRSRPFLVTTPIAVLSMIVVACSSAAPATPQAPTVSSPRPVAVVATTTHPESIPSTRPGAGATPGPSGSEVNVAITADAAGMPPPSFVPASAVAWGSIRLDLPGAQGDLADRVLATIDLDGRQVGAADRIAELVDTMLLRGTPMSYATDIQPWFDGHVVIAALPPSRIGDVAGWTAGVVVGLGVTDADQAATFMETVLADDSGAFRSSELDYRGTTIVTRLATDGYSPSISWTTVDGWLLASLDPFALAEAVDGAMGTDSLAGAERGGIAAQDALVGAWVDLAATISALTHEGATSAMLDEVLGLAGVDRSILPTSADAGLALDASGIGLDLRISADPGVLLPAPRPVSLATWMPASTFAYAEVHDLGAVGAPIVRRWRGPDGTPWALSPLEDRSRLRVVDVLGQLGDVAIGASMDRGSLQIGLVATLRDAAASQVMLDRLALVLEVMEQRGAGGVDVSATEVDGVIVTTYSVAALQGLPGRGIPLDGAIEVAIKDGHLLVGSGSFVSDALTREATGSLASAPLFQAETGDAGDVLALVFLDARAVLTATELIGASLPALDPRLRNELDTMSLILSGGPGELTARLHASLASLGGATR